ncbi:MAG: thiaminase II [Calditrichia bacterium]
MSTTPFYDHMRMKADSLWKSIFTHPFVEGIGNGSLSQDRFEFYLKQDYIYLIDFSRVFALAAAKAARLEEMSYFATLLHATLNMEMELHRKTCEGFGISSEELEKTPPAMITSAYTNLLVRTCYQGNLKDILAVLLPCAAGYVEIGQRLKEKGLPEVKHYQDWINTYSSQEFLDLTNWLIDRMNSLAVGASREEKKHWYSLYLSSARFEYLFFDMSWKKEIWPAGLSPK